ncbi:MAG: 16S rRNA (guanine(966)-N(2))-methyltransferase RsmD [Candidatus Berkiellales bacterium]
MPGKIRIIGGKWRGRQLKVIAASALRPTPDRIRETLFNWLATQIVDARCLDLFAGTGALGFESLSRGAKQVVFVESHLPAVNMLKSTIENLGVQNACEVIFSDAVKWLQQTPDTPYDVIFLDPPFSSPLLQQCLPLLESRVGPHTLIYIEARNVLNHNTLPTHWQILKQKTAGEVAYHLVQGSAK